MSSPMIPTATPNSPARLELSQEIRDEPRERDPWEESCILTLDGGGIRGYASLWAVKCLMDAIAKVETEGNPKEPHESSFCPMLEENQRPNGSATHSQIEQIPANAVTGTRTTSGFSILPIGRGRSTKDLQPTPNKRLSEENTDGSSSKKGYWPCHYFNYIAGTSTGGLNAIMLGRLRMSVEECLENYPKMAENIFTGKKKSKMTRLMKNTSSKYDCGRLQDEIKKVVNCKAHKEPPRQERYDFERFPLPEDLCKTVVVANECDEEGSGETVYLFRTYTQKHKSAKNPGPAHDHEIWRVARATSAAPTFFPPITIDNKEYSDGGVGYNNPAQLMLDEVIYMAGEGSSLKSAVGALVSIGAGQKPTTREKVKHKFPGLSSVKLLKELSKIIEKLKDRATDVERVEEHVSQRCKDNGLEHYYRWTGGEKVGGLEMDKWRPEPKGNKKRTADYIEEHVKAYMAQPEQKERLDKCAQELVRRRRQRINYEPQLGLWKRYKDCILIECVFCDSLLENREKARHHIVIDHSEKLNPTLDFTLEGRVSLDALVGLLKEKWPMHPGGPL